MLKSKHYMCMVEGIIKPIYMRDYLWETETVGRHRSLGSL